MGYNYGWAPYVPVAKRRAKAKKKIAKLKKKGVNIQPIEIEGRKIATSFWGKAWCDHIESFSDYENRLPRGRRYARNGSVCHLEINAGEIKAIVSGSELYNVNINIDPLPVTRWEYIKKTCAGQISSLLDLLKGILSDGVMNVVCHRKLGLFPLSGKIKVNCDCPDWATMCKHVAAVLYGVGARLDNDPSKLFLLRGVDHKELVDLSDAVMGVTQNAQKKHQHMDNSDLSDIFGIDLSVNAPNQAKSLETKPTSKTNHTIKTTESKKSTSAAATKKGKKNKKTPTKIARTTTKRATSSARKKITPKKAIIKTRKIKTTATKAQAVSAFPVYLTGSGLRKKRQALALTQKQLAEKLGLSASTISQWEAKQRKRLQPGIEVLKKLKRFWRKMA